MLMHKSALPHIDDISSGVLEWMEDLVVPLIGSVLAIGTCLMVPSCRAKTSSLIHKTQSLFTTEHNEDLHDSMLHAATQYGTSGQIHDQNDLQDV